MPYTVRNLLTETFRDLAILAAGETLDTTDAEFGLEKLTRLFDDWNADRSGVYAVRQTTYTLVPALQPHTIGPTASSPTFTVTQRPVSIDSANLIIDGDTDVNRPLNLRDSQWWSSLTVPTLSTAIPTDLYYSPDWPLGRLYLWPVPASAYGLQLMTRVVLADLGIDDTVSLPPGYRSAVILTLGEMIAPTYPPAQPNPEAASKARARIWANNDVTPRLATRDSGMPGSRGGHFNYLTGMNEP